MKLMPSALQGFNVKMLYNKLIVWNVGVIFIYFLIITAFIGYVLPWGQMSFWAATVITNLLSAIPYVEDQIVRRL